MAKQRNPNGTGSYRLRKDGRYQWTQKKDGKERVLYGRTPKELQEKVKKVADLPVTSTKLKVDDWFDKWLEVYIKPLKKDATYQQYKILYDEHIKPEIGYRKLNGLQTIDIQSVISKMNKKEYKNKKGEVIKVGTSTWTMKHVRKIMSIAFKKAFDEKLISFNPVVKIEIPNKQAKPRKTLTLDELKRLFKAMGSSRWIWSIKFMLVTGLRRGELLALKWSDVDRENRRLTVDKSYGKTGVGDTKSAKVHYVPLSDTALDYLEEQKQMLEREFNPILHNKELGKADLIFPSENGVMLRSDSYYTLLSRFAKKAEIKASPHCLRHTFVYLTRDSMTLKEIQAALGHDESTTTLDIYGDILNDSTIKAASKIDSVFSAITDKLEENKKEDETIPKAEKKCSAPNVVSLDAYRKAK